MVKVGMDTDSPHNVSVMVGYKANEILTPSFSKLDMMRIRPLTRLVSHSFMTVGLVEYVIRGASVLGLGLISPSRKGCPFIKLQTLAVSVLQYDI
jgi:hypothetical protein